MLLSSNIKQPVPRRRFRDKITYFHSKNAKLTEKNTQIYSKFDYGITVKNFFNF